jgi:UDP-N-acetylglucosamine--N-acetylmuramyl-(pentapeptide) pyrophosphoryl-undecaprenol N-acetylglucosamine transferase
MRVTGNPVRRAFTERWDETELTRQTALVHRELNLAAPDSARPLPRVLVTGGSLGALQLNTLLSQTIAALTSEAFVVHQTGAHSEEMIPSIAAAAAPGRYAAAAAFDSLFPTIVRTADLVIARAGAGTIWEIAVAGRPSILIPLSRGASRGDQIRNARRYARSGAAVVLEDPDLSAAEFLAVVRKILRDPDRRDAMGAAAREWAPADAADRIVVEISAVIDESASVRAAASDSGTVL